MRKVSYTTFLGHFILPPVCCRMGVLIWFFQNIGAYWTLIPENDETKTKGRSEMESMSPPASTSVPSPPSNFRKRSSTMPTNLNRPQRPSKFKVWVKKWIYGFHKSQFLAKFTAFTFRCKFCWWRFWNTFASQFV